MENILEKEWHKDYTADGYICITITGAKIITLIGTENTDPLQDDTIANHIVELHNSRLWEIKNGKNN